MTDGTQAPGTPHSATTDDTAAADARFIEWMHLNLQHAAEHFEIVLAGEPIFGWRLRTIGAPGTAPGGDRWLRVVSEFPDWASGDTWTGNSDAEALTTIPRPRVLDVLEWTEADWRRQRAELMTLLPGHPVSSTDDLHLDPELSSTWWSDLHQALADLHCVSTSRTSIDPDRIRERTLRTYGTAIEVDQWETIHGDLHWNNIFAPALGILDWEFWGRGPAGTDEATMYLFSLRVPDVAEHVHATFRAVLDSPAGRVAQLIAAARLKGRINDGDFPELAEPLRAHVDQLGMPFTDQR